MARTQAVTILFCDLVASTERRARLGDDAFDEFSARFLKELRDAIERAGGREVSNAGDGLMVVFTASVADAVTCAMEMHEHVRALDATDPPLLRIGISCGEVAEDGDNYSGMPIVEAARLESAAAPGQTLANHVVRALVGTRRALRFRDVGALTLKGIPEPLDTVEVLHADVVDVPSAAPSARSGPAAPTSAGPRRLWIVAAVAVVLVIAVVAVVALTQRDTTHAKARTAAVLPGIVKPSGYTPAYEPHACPSALRRTVPDATCGDLVVPEDRSKPHGNRVRLLIQQAPARVPGQSKAAPNIDVCGCNDLATSLARDHSRLILIGGRGYLSSKPDLTCPEVSTVARAALAEPSDDPVELTKETTAIGACYARITRAGIDPAQYNFATSTLDVTDLMLALHIKSADFTGSNLTSAVVFGVLRKAPGVVRSITLDNPAPPGESVLSDPIGDLSHAFNRFAALCSANAACRGSYPDLGAEYRASWQRYQAHPVLVTVPNPDASSGATVRVLLDGPRVADALAQALGNSDTYSLIPAAITTDSAAPLIAAQVVQGDPFAANPAASWGAQLSFFCSNDVHTADPGAVALAAHTLPQFRGSQTAHWDQFCSAWKVPDISAELGDDVASPVPAFLFRGDLSANGSTAWINTIERRLPNGQSAVFPTQGDGLIANGPPCLAQLRRKFLANPRADFDPAACVQASQSPPINFDAPAA